MQDPHHQGGHGHHHHHHDPKHHHEPHHEHHHDPHDADREAEGDDGRPTTPSYLRPPVAGRAQSDSGSEPSLPQSRSVEFDVPCPVSPTRPKSPWGRFDPYNNNEVTQRRRNPERIKTPSVWFSSALKGDVVCVL